MKTKHEKYTKDEKLWLKMLEDSTINYFRPRIEIIRLLIDKGWTLKKEKKPNKP